MNKDFIKSGRWFGFLVPVCPPFLSTLQAAFKLFDRLEHRPLSRSQRRTGWLAHVALKHMPNKAARARAALLVLLRTAGQFSARSAARRPDPTFVKTIKSFGLYATKKVIGNYCYDRKPARSQSSPSY